MTEDEKAALRKWMIGGPYMGGPKSLAYMVSGLAEIACDISAELASKIDAPENSAQQMTRRQWERMIPRLQQLAEWAKDFGPGSGCR